MRKILGILLIACGILGGFFLGIIMLIYGLWDILTNLDTLTFWQFAWDVVLIAGRGIVAIIVAAVLVLIGLWLIDTKYKKTHLFSLRGKFKKRKIR